jgi:hypothetical protein
MRILLLSLLALTALLIAGCTQLDVAAGSMEQPSVNTNLMLAHEDLIRHELTDVFIYPTCTDEGVVTLVLLNTGTTDLHVSDINFNVDDEHDDSPDCLSQVLTPGESTVCSGLNQDQFGVPLLRIELPDGETFIQKVTCA